MTDPSLLPPLIMGVPDSTGMGGIPSLGSSLVFPIPNSTQLEYGNIRLVWPIQK